jgi:hypothetical protein
MEDRTGEFEKLKDYRIKASVKSDYRMSTHETKGFEREGLEMEGLGRKREGVKELYFI